LSISPGDVAGNVDRALVTATVDPSQVTEVREEFPALADRRL